MNPFAEFEEKLWMTAELAQDFLAGKTSVPLPPEFTEEVQRLAQCPAAHPGAMSAPLREWANKLEQEIFISKGWRK